MAAIDEQTLLAFEDELFKTAGPYGQLEAAALKYGPKAVQFLRRGAGAAGAGLGLGAAAGGVIGGAHGAYTGYRQAEEQGGSGVAGALGGLARGAGKGAATGGAIGAATGLAAGGMGGRAASALEEASKARNVVGSTARFGQRQVHGLTGLVPGGAARGTPEYTRALHNLDFDSGSRSAAREITKANRGLDKAKSTLENAHTDQLLDHVQGVGSFGDTSRGVRKATRGVDKATKGLESARTRYQTAREAEEKGLTNLPGYVRALGSRQGAKDVWRLGVKPQLTQQGAMGKVMAGMAVAGAVPELATSGKQDPEGRGRGERFGRALGMGVGYTAAPFMPISASEVLARGAGRAAGTVGKGVDTVIGALRRRPPEMGVHLGNSAAAPGTGASASTEVVPRIHSNAALGKPPEGLFS